MAVSGVNQSIRLTPEEAGTETAQLQPLRTVGSRYKFARVCAGNAARNCVGTESTDCNQHRKRCQSSKVREPGLQERGLSVGVVKCLRSRNLLRRPRSISKGPSALWAGKWNFFSEVGSVGASLLRRGSVLIHDQVKQKSESGHLGNHVTYPHPTFDTFLCCVASDNAKHRTKRRHVLTQSFIELDPICLVANEQFYRKMDVDASVIYFFQREKKFERKQST